MKFTNNYTPMLTVWQSKKFDWHFFAIMFIKKWEINGHSLFYLEKNNNGWMFYVRFPFYNICFRINVS